MSREFRHRMSLGLNFLLVVAIVVLVCLKSGRAPEPSAAAPVAENIVVEKPAAPAQPKAPQYSSIASAPDRYHWLADQLRAAGVPNNVVARMLLSEVDEDWQKHFDEVALKTHGNPEVLVALHIEQEKDTEAQMRAALGEAGFKQWDQERMLREANFGKVQLTAAEADTIYDLKKKLQQRQWDLAQARADGKMDEAQINEAIDKAFSDFNQQMKTLLGEERYAKSQGVEDVAGNLRSDLANANPSDAQFQDLLQAQQQLNDRRAAIDKQFQENPSSPDYAAQLKALDDARDHEFQRVLGTNVFGALQKEQDIGYNKMKKYESIWGLDDGKIDYVYGALKYYEKSVNDYQAQAHALEAQGQRVDWTVAQKNLQQFAQQTQQTLQTYLGADSFGKMQRNGLFQFDQLPQPAQFQ